MRGGSAEIVSLLRQILAELQTLSARLEAPAAAANRLSARDLERLEIVLPAISTAIGDAVFTAPELVDHADASDPELRRALAEAFGSAPGGRAIGKLLAKAELAKVGAHRVERAGAARDGVLWRVEFVSEFREFETRQTCNAPEPVLLESQPSTAGQVR